MALAQVLFKPPTKCRYYRDARCGGRARRTGGRTRRVSGYRAESNDVPDLGAKRSSCNFRLSAVTFSPGDRVLVTAGGCVQTGGYGPTWKRYVRPTGPDADHSYFGTIDIPGGTNGVVRLSAVVGQTLPVAAAGSLRLGYVDDKYHDNGYDSHDDGTDNQCANSVNAFVSLTIDHASAQTATCGGNTGAKLLDLVWTDCDPNGFPLNPRWRSQINDNGLVPSAPARLCPAGIQSCTSWPLSYDIPDLFSLQRYAIGVMSIFSPQRTPDR